MVFRAQLRVASAILCASIFRGIAKHESNADVKKAIMENCRYALIIDHSSRSLSLLDSLLLYFSTLNFDLFSHSILYSTYSNTVHVSFISSVRDVRMFEEKAMRVLTACYEEKTEACTEAVSVLRSPLWLLAGYSVMDVASEAHLMYFLSHPACQEAATKLWSGALDPTVPAWRVRVAS